MMTEQVSDLATIAFVGDSLVSGGRWSEWISGRTVLNLGVSGDATTQVLSRLDEVVATAPDEILLLIGTNDLGRRRSVEDLVRDAQTLLVKLREALPHSRVLVHSIFPRGKDFARSIQQANIHLRQFCATVHAQYLDLWPVLAREDGSIDPAFSPDGLHLNDDGYRVWVQELLPALERLREQPTMTGPVPSL